MLKWIISFCTVPSRKKREKRLREYDKSLAKRFFSGNILGQLGKVSSKSDIKNIEKKILSFDFSAK